MNRVVVAPEDLMSVPVGSLISVGRRLSGMMLRELTVGVRR